MRGEHYYLCCQDCTQAIELVHREYSQPPYRMQMKDADEAQRFLLQHPNHLWVTPASQTDLESWKSEWRCGCAAPECCPRCKGTGVFWATRHEREFGDQVAAPDIKPLLDRMCKMFERYYVDGPAEVEMRFRSTPRPQRTPEPGQPPRPPRPPVPARIEKVSVDISLRTTVTVEDLERLFGKLDTWHGEEERVWAGSWTEEAAYKYLMPRMLGLIPHAPRRLSIERVVAALDVLNWQDWSLEERAITAHCLAATRQRVVGPSTLALPLAQSDALKGATRVNAGLNGTIWVLNEPKTRVWRVDPHSGRVELFVDADALTLNPEREVVQLADVAGDALGNIYLSCGRAGVLYVDAATRQVRATPVGRADGGGHSYVRGLHLAQNGKLYVAEPYRDRVVCFDTGSAEISVEVEDVDLKPELVVLNGDELWVLKMVDVFWHGDKRIGDAFVLGDIRTFSRSPDAPWEEEAEGGTYHLDFAAGPRLGIITLWTNHGEHRNVLREAQRLNQGGKYFSHFDSYTPPGFDASQVTAIAATPLGVIVALEADTGRLWLIAPGPIFDD